MNKLDLDYQALLKDILENGVKKEDRTGTGTLSVFGRQIRHKMSDGFPLLTTKKMHWKSVVSELLWFLSGRTDLKWLLDHDNTIWVGDCWKNYSSYVQEEWESGVINELFEDGLIIEIKESFDYECESRQINYRQLTKEEFINKIKTDDEFAKKWGSLGKIYGHQWRKWTGQVDDISGIGCYHDQITNLINDLKTNPDSRRLMVSAWNVGELDQMVLPPCHYGFQVYTRELSMSEKELWYKNNNINPNKPWYPNWPTRAISLMWNQRSVDTPLGLPFNIASYGLLLEILGKITNMVPDELIGNLGDTHIYLNQIEGVKEQLTREPFELPKLVINDEFWNHEWQTADGLVSNMEIGDFIIENYQSHPTIKMPLSN